MSKKRRHYSAEFKFKGETLEIGGKTPDYDGDGVMIGRSALGLADE